MSNLLLKNISELVTMSPLVQRGDFNSITDKDLGRISNAWLALSNGRVEDYGTGEIPSFLKIMISSMLRDVWLLQD